MASAKIPVKCKYYNKGFCKYREECNYFHPKDVCQEVNCNNKKCKKRHPKQCRYKDECRRRSLCMYSHESVIFSEYQTILNENVTLKLDILNLKVKLKETVVQLKSVTEELENTSNQSDRYAEGVRDLVKRVSEISEDRRLARLQMSQIMSSPLNKGCHCCGKIFSSDSEIKEHTDNFRGYCFACKVCFKPIYSCDLKSWDLVEHTKCPGVSTT